MALAVQKAVRTTVENLVVPLMKAIFLRIFLTKDIIFINIEIGIDMVGDRCPQDLIGNPVQKSSKPERSRHCRVESCTIMSLG